jgi:hypothetical protein
MRLDMLRAALIFCLIAGLPALAVKEIFDPDWSIPNDPAQHQAWWNMTVADSQRNDRLIRACHGDFACANQSRDLIQHEAAEWQFAHRGHAGFREIEEACFRRTAEHNSGGLFGGRFIWERELDIIDTVECMKERHAD